MAHATMVISMTIVPETEIVIVALTIVLISNANLVALAQVNVSRETVTIFPAIAVTVITEIPAIHVAVTENVTVTRLTA